MKNMFFPVVLLLWYVCASSSPTKDKSIANQGATFSVANSLTVSEQSNLPWEQRGSDIDGEAAGDAFGSKVSLNSDGSVVAIGAIFNDDNGDKSGHVKVFAWDGTTWVQRGLDIVGEAAGDETGSAVSLSSDGGVVAIGANLNDNNGLNSGHVRVFAWDGSAWVQRGLDINGEMAGDNAGFAVSLSGDGSVVAVGAYGSDPNGSYSGNVKVFTWDGTTWLQRGLNINGEAANDSSGRAVALSSDGNVVAIGAYANDGNGSNSGHVRVYAWNGTAWVQRGLDINGEAAGDLFGDAVSLSNDGGIVAIGASENDGNGSNSGHVRVFSWNGTAWVQRGLDIDGEAASDLSGNSVSLSSDGNVVAIGAYGNDGNGGSSGHVRVYAWDGMAWLQRGLDIDGEASVDYFGRSVSLSSDGRVVAIGASGNDDNGSNSGHVRVYVDLTSLPPTISPTVVPTTIPTTIPTTFNPPWEQRGSDIDGEAAGDYFGYSAALSSDGSVVAIGAIFNDDNGPYSGHVRVFAWDGTTWVQRGVDIVGEAAGDYFGVDVSLSSDGTVVAVGAVFNDGNGSNSGHVRVFTWDGTTWVQRGLDIDGEAVDDQSGDSVSLSTDGSVIAIGAILNDGGGNNSGHVRIFVWDSTTWVQRGSDIDGEAAGDRFGYSSSLSSDGSVVAIGALYNDGNGGNSGHARVFAWDGTTWSQRGLDIDGEASSDYFGVSVSLSGDGSVVAIGADANHNNNGAYSGHVKVFTWNGTTWVQRGSNIEGEASYDASGYSVSISSDGSVVAIGAYGNDDNGINSGHVRVFRWDGTTWVQRGLDIDGEAAGDKSGRFVTISSDGRVVAIGAQYNDGNGSNSGHVRVYFDPTSLPPTAVPTTVPTAPSALPTIVPTTVPTAVPTTVPTVAPTTVPTLAPTTVPTAIPAVIIESDHKYAPYTNEEWIVEIPNTTCYAVTMDPQSWTPHSGDVVQIFGITTRGNEGDVQKRYPIVGGQLYKRRLRNFGTMDINADKIKVVFKSDGSKQAWGFKLYLTKCT